MKPTSEMQQVLQLLLDMFTTSRGHGLIDSGSAYGYASDSNRHFGLDQQPFVLKQELETGYHGCRDKGVHASFASARYWVYIFSCCFQRSFL